MYKIHQLCTREQVLEVLRTYQSGLSWRIFCLMLQPDPDTLRDKSQALCRINNDLLLVMYR